MRDGLSKKDPVIGLLCGVTSFYEFRSTNNTLNVQFTSRSLIPSQGFRASYFFEPIKSFAAQPALNQTINNELDQAYPFHETTERTNELYGFSASLDSTRGRSLLFLICKVKTQRLSGCSWLIFLKFAWWTLFHLKPSSLQGQWFTAFYFFEAWFQLNYNLLLDLSGWLSFWATPKPARFTAFRAKDRPDML